MPHLLALAFLLLISPAAGVTGLLLLVQPHELVRLVGRLSDWNRRALGIGPENPGLGWMHTPVHKRLLGERETLVRRMCEEPERFTLLNAFLRVDGLLLIAVSLAAAAGAAAGLAT